MKRLMMVALAAATGMSFAAEPKTGEEVIAAGRPPVAALKLPKEGCFIGSGVYGAEGKLFNTGLCFTYWRPSKPQPEETPRLCAEERTGNTLQFWFNLANSKLVESATKEGLYSTAIYGTAKADEVKKLRAAAGDKWLGLDYGERFTFRMEDEDKDKSRGAKNLKSLADDLVARVHAHVKKMHADGWGTVMSTGGHLYFDYEVLGGTEIPLVEDFPFFNMHRSSALCRGLLRQYNLPMWGSHFAHDWYSYLPRTNPYKMKMLETALRLKYVDGAKMLINESGNWTCQGSFAPDEPQHYMPKTPGEKRFGKKMTPELYDPIKEEGRKKFAYVDYRSPVATKYRKILTEFTDFCATNPAPVGQPESPFAIVKGNFDLNEGNKVPGYAIANAFDLADKDIQWYIGEPERSWDLLMDIVYPMPTDIVWPNGNNRFGGTPYGQADIVSFAYDNVTAEHLLKNYKALIFAGWNTCSEKQYKILCDYVKGGGKLVISIPHLSTDLNRNYTNFKLEDLVNGGDFSELCGLKVTARDSRFYWATGWELKPNRVGYYAPRRYGIISQHLGKLEFTGPKENYEILAADDEEFRPVIVSCKNGKGEVYFCNIWAYPSACNNDFGAGCDYRCKGLMGELYAYVMREAHGNVWITGPDFEKPDGDCDYITYSYFPDDGRICLMNMDYRNERKCVLHWFGEKDFITLKPGELRFMAAPKLDPDEKLNVK